jgi:hypothetical protein
MRAFFVVNCQSALVWFGITVVLPGGDFLDESCFVGNAAIEALGRRRSESLNPFKLVEAGD